MLVLAGAAFFYLRWIGNIGGPHPGPLQQAGEGTVAPQQDVPRTDVELTKQQMLKQLDKQENNSRTLALPKAPAEVPVPEALSIPTPLSVRAEGRKKREGLPMGVVIVDDVPAYPQKNARNSLYRMMTGDMVRVFPDQDAELYHVQPGLDIYLVATTKETKPAGERFPDVDVWVRKSDLKLFEPADAKDFIMETSPVTLGNDPSFSTIGFYERAMKNPDPVVHRVVGPRLIALVLLHEDYSSSWSVLYRDRDQKIRDYALSALNQRGIGENREVIEDLIARLAELTKDRARGEIELEVLSILNVLKNSHHPRVPAALASFKETWKDTQNLRLNAELDEILKNPTP